ncbi:MAG: hypothetical protein IKQ61_07045 [Spirochaetales bacterium]|nr:hypothetical protein [Spirochaetales bacterium]
MDKIEFIEKGYKSKKYEYDIGVVQTVPPKVSLYYEGKPICTCIIPIESFINEMFDNKTQDSIHFSIDMLKSDVDAGFVDKFIDKYKAKNK